MKSLNSIFTLLLLSSAYSLFSQTYIGRGEVMDDFFMQNRNKVKSTSNIDGTSSFNKEWEKGVITFKDGKEYIVENLKYDIYYNRLLFLNNEIEYYVPETFNIKSFSISNSEFINMKVDNDNFFEVILSGAKMDLLKKYSCTVKEGNSDNGIVRATNASFDIRSYYYIKTKNGSIIKLSTKKNFVLNLFAGKKEEVARFTKKNRLKFNKENDLKTLIDYYNSL
jgi:hypothetical protein